MTDGDRLGELIGELLSILRTGEHDLTWTRYDTVEQLIAELEELRDRIADGDDAARRQFRFLCLPTGTFDVIAISSGWVGTWISLVHGEYRSEFT